MRRVTSGSAPPRPARASAGVRLLVHFAAIAAILLWADPATAHGLGERYTLPLPLSLYLSGAGLVVALSFLLLAVFSRAGARKEGRAQEQATVLPIPPWPGERAVAMAVRTLSAALFVLLMAAGFLGSPSPFKNPLPVSVWIIGWIGIAYVSALLGNVWALINPWDNLFRLGEWLFSRSTSRQPRPPLAYPAGLGAWPAVALFIGFAWMELVWPARDHPASLAAAILAYSVVTWGGMVAFGRRTWIENGEAFAVAFGLLARFAVIGQREGREGERNRPVLRPPAAGLLVRAPVSPSIAAFALIMLATVTFDGLLETPLWAAIAEWGLGTATLQQAGALSGLEPYLIFATAALVLFPMIFAALYLVLAHLMALAASPGAGRVKTGETARFFVLTLVPIAIGYHLSHYLASLLIAGQFIIPIASDPFALGWNLFGTKLYLIDFSLIDARLVWFASLALIVAGHVIAVWLAHIQARRLFAEPRRIMWSQIPLLALMVGYTIVSLWILAQPITQPGPD